GGTPGWREDLHLRRSRRQRHRHPPRELMVIVARRTPPAEMMQNHNRVAGAISAEERERAPRAANVGAVREIWSPVPLVYRGRLIPARPIQWEEGLDLMEAALELERWTEGRKPEGSLTREELTELRAIYRRIM